MSALMRSSKGRETEVWTCTGIFKSWTCPGIVLIQITFDVYSDGETREGKMTWPELAKFLTDGNQPVEEVAVLLIGSATGWSLRRMRNGHVYIDTKGEQKREAVNE